MGLVFGTGAAFTGAGILGFALVAGAGFVDSRFLMPALLGRKQKGQRSEELLSLPQAGVGLGTPRVWAFGNRVRVPVHVMYQGAKERETTGGGGKAGTSGAIQRVYADVCVALNDRYTTQIQQLVGNGKLLIVRERNLIYIRTSSMTVSSPSTGKIRVQMQSVFDPDFRDKFKVDDFIKLDGFVPGATSSDVTQGYWRVSAVVNHNGGVPSYMDLNRWSGQAITNVTQITAGTLASPATVYRVDDVVINDYNSFSNGRSGVITNPFPGDPYVFIVAWSNYQQWVDGDDVVRYVLQGGANIAIDYLTKQNVQLASQTYTTLPVFNQRSYLFTISDTNAFWYHTSANGNIAGVARCISPSLTLPGLVTGTPVFYQGTETQGEDTQIATREVTGTIPGFRGVSYVTLDRMNLSTFGNQVPQVMEALIDPDPGMTWQEAIRLVCNRHGLADAEIDITRVDALPFEGMYLRGTVTGVSALQPLLVAGQILTQERDGVLSFFQLDDAEVVAIENGASFSDLGAYVGSDTPLKIDKIQHGQLDPNDLPSSVAVRHQDPDNLYAEGYQKFALRSPNTDKQDNTEEVDLRMMVLSRKQARNLAATLMRRAWVNAQTVEMILPASYVDLLENDLVTVTDDNGDIVTARIISRDVGGNFLVHIKAVREELNLAVSGSPVQDSGYNVPRLESVATLNVAVLDIPPLLDDHAAQPGIYLAACATSGAWQGAQVWESRDSGTNYEHVGDLLDEWQIGTTTTSLASTATYGETVGASGLYTDTVNTVTVRFDSTGPGWLPLNNWTDADVKRGRGWFLIGDEILAAKSAELQSDGSYLLKQLVRGLRSTYRSCDSTKAAGQQVVRLDSFMASNLFRAFDNGTAQTLPSTRYYKVIPAGATLADVTAIQVTAQAWNARPMPVRYLTKTIGASPYDVTFAFEHWSRLNFEPGTEIKPPVDESFEGYTLRIYSGAGALLRTKNVTTRGTGTGILRDKWVVYTAAEQTADGLTPSSSATFSVEIEQDGEFGQGKTWRRTI